MITAMITHRNIEVLQRPDDSSWQNLWHDPRGQNKSHGVATDGYRAAGEHRIYLHYTVDRGHTSAQFL